MIAKKSSAGSLDGVWGVYERATAATFATRPNACDGVSATRLVCNAGCETAGAVPRGGGASGTATSSPDSKARSIFQRRSPRSVIGKASKSRSLSRNRSSNSQLNLSARSLLVAAVAWRSSAAFGKYVSRRRWTVTSASRGLILSIDIRTWVLWGDIRSTTN
jgi:hypothetical protein